MNQNDAADLGKETQQTGDTLTINASAYKGLADLQEGDPCTLKVIGKVEAVGDDGTIDIAPTSIEQMDVNPAKQSLREMRKPGMPVGTADKEDQLEGEEN